MYILLVVVMEVVVVVVVEKGVRLRVELKWLTRDQSQVQVHQGVHSFASHNQ